MALNETQQKLATLIACPIDWSQTPHTREFAALLRYFWYRSVRACQGDGESNLLTRPSVFYPEDSCIPNEFYIESIFDTADCCERQLWHIEQWRNMAAGQYERKFGRFRDLRPATALDYPKHYAPIGSSDREVARLSVVSGHSKLFPRADLKLQASVSAKALTQIWYAQEASNIRDVEDLVDTSVVIEAFETVFGGHALTAAVECDTEVGCSAGVPTNWLFLDYSLSTSIFHTYPISEKESVEVEFRFRASESD